MALQRGIDSKKEIQKKKLKNEAKANKIRSQCNNLVNTKVTLHVNEGSFSNTVLDIFNKIQLTARNYIGHPINTLENEAECKA